MPLKLLTKARYIWYQNRIIHSTIWLKSRARSCMKIKSVSGLGQKSIFPPRKCQLWENFPEHSNNNNSKLLIGYSQSGWLVGEFPELIPAMSEKQENTHLGQERQKSGFMLLWWSKFFNISKWNVKLCTWKCGSIYRNV